MHLRRFVAQHPSCTVGRPDWTTPLSAMVASALVSLGALIAANHTAGSGSDGAALLWLLLGLGLVYPTGLAARAFAPRWRLARQGLNCWALADQDLLLVDAEGNAITVALDRIVDLSFLDGELRLGTDSELQGVIYSVIFRLFDGDLPGPSADLFYEVLTARLSDPRGSASTRTSEHPARLAA